MNKERRKKLEDLKQQLADLQGKVNDIGSEIESLKDEEQDYHDNMPGAMQCGEKGDNSQTAIDALDSAKSEVDEVESAIENSIGYIDNAIEV